MTTYFLKGQFGANWDDTRKKVESNNCITVHHFHDETIDTLIFQFELLEEGMNGLPKEENTIEISFKIKDLYHILADLPTETTDD